MALDLAKAHGWVVAELERRRPIEISMDALIDLCSASLPHPDWDKLRALPFGETGELEKWIRRLFEQELHPAPLKALWFGLFNPCDDEGNPIADLYVSGATKFAPDPYDNSWAVAPAWWPDGRYAHSSLLADLYKLAYRQGRSDSEQMSALGNDAEYPLCLAYGALVVRQLLGSSEARLILGDAKSLGVAVGFDSGDFVLIDSIA